MDRMLLLDSPSRKAVVSPEYNYLFDKRTGGFRRWGETVNDDPEWSPFGCEILDIEISVGNCSGKCPWCYKSNNTGMGFYMSLDLFKTIIDKLTPFLTQVALGITDVDASPDLIPIMEYCREVGVIPNLTLTGYGLTEELLHDIIRLAGAVSVSVYPHTKDLAYETINRLLEPGKLAQVNMHLLYYQENEYFVRDVLFDVEQGHISPNAVVLLALKTKGRAETGFTPMSYDRFAKLIDDSMRAGIPLGFDSCSACKFLRWMEQSDLSAEKKEQLRMRVEPCESGLFSWYVNVEGKAFPCSFTEDVEGITGLDMLCKNFLQDVWMHPTTQNWRDRLLENNRGCPVYDI